MLSPELLEQVRKIQWRAGHLVTESLAGNYQSAFRGQGMEFDAVREYVPGDDIRMIDWNVTARARSPHIKIFREEREMTMMLMVDVSPSQAFGTVGKDKRQMAAELAAVLAFLATKNNDKVGLIAFSDHVEQVIPPKKGRGHVWNIIRSILSHEGQGQRTDLAHAIDHSLLLLKRRSAVFVISDFWAPEFSRSLRQLGKRHDGVCAVVRDPLEQALPPSGLVNVIDSETGQPSVVNASDKTFRQSYQQAMQEHHEQLTHMFRKCAVDAIHFNTGGSLVDPLIAYMHGRERRRRR